MPENTLPSFAAALALGADDEENYRKYFSMGIGTLLTNRIDLGEQFKI